MIDRLQVKDYKLSLCTLRAPSCVVSQRFSSVMRKKNVLCRNRDQNQPFDSFPAH